MGFHARLCPDSKTLKKCLRDERDSGNKHTPFNRRKSLAFAMRPPLRSGGVRGHNREKAPGIKACPHTLTHGHAKEHASPYARAPHTKQRPHSPQETKAPEVNKQQTDVNQFPKLLKVTWRGPSASLSAHVPSAGTGGAPQTLAVLDPMGVVRRGEEAGRSQRKWTGNSRGCGSCPAGLVKDQ